MPQLTQFGGGKTHTLTTLYHLARNGDDARQYPGIDKLLATVLLLAPIPWAQRAQALPFLTVLAPSEHYDDDRKQQYKLLTDWARQMITQVRAWLPKRPLIVTADSSYAALALPAASQGLAEPVTIVTQLRLDAALYCHNRLRMDARSAVAIHLHLTRLHPVPVEPLARLHSQPITSLKKVSTQALGHSRPPISISPIRKVTAEPERITRSPRTSHRTVPPRAEAWYAIRRCLPSWLAQ
jgi:hypothetical protein